MTDQANNDNDLLDCNTTQVSGDHEIDDNADLDDMNAAWDRIKADQVFLDPPTTSTATATLNGHHQEVEHTLGCGGDIVHSCTHTLGCGGDIVHYCTRLVLMSDTHGAHRHVLLHPVMFSFMQEALPNWARRGSSGV